MNKTELETIALDCLERLKTEAKSARQSQDEKIQYLENRVNSFEQQLTRLSGLLLNLNRLTDGLNGILPNGRGR